MSGRRTTPTLPASWGAANVLVARVRGAIYEDHGWDEADYSNGGWIGSRPRGRGGGGEQRGVEAQGVLGGAVEEAAVRDDDEWPLLHHAGWPQRVGETR